MENRERKHEIERRYRQGHPEVMNAKTQRWRANHPEYRGVRNKANYELKQRILTHYGNGKQGCVICGEDRLECLSIDHINNNGNQHRREIGNLHGTAFYHWLRRENYPSGYQTLCMNCQFIKALQRRN